MQRSCGARVILSRARAPFARLTCRAARTARTGCPPPVGVRPERTRARQLMGAHAPCARGAFSAVVELAIFFTIAMTMARIGCGGPAAGV